MTLRESIYMYLKPQNSNITGVHCLLVILDSLLTMIFLMAICINVAMDDFTTVNDKVIEGLIGLALPVIASLYASLDGFRFLPETGAILDKALYMISCFLFQKPILLPMLLPNRFKSVLATSRFSEQPIVRINGRMPPTFVLAIQETNFFYSFTMSFFVALTVMCDQIMDWHFDKGTGRVLFGLSLIQWLFGMFVTIYLYGRKVSSDDEDDEDDES